MCAEIVCRAHCYLPRLYSPHPAPRARLHHHYPPTLRLPNFPTSQQVEKPTSQHVGKLASWHPPPRRESSARSAATLLRYLLHSAMTALCNHCKLLSPLARFLLPRGKPKNHPPALTALCNHCTTQSPPCTRTRPPIHPAPTRPARLHQRGETTT